MISLRRSFALPLALATAIGASACGSEGDSATNNTTATTVEAATSEPADTTTDEGDLDEDHDDEDHDDDDHDDDHDDDDHGGESGGLGAHEHGTAELSVAWIDAEVAIDLITPTFNVFGFEYEPTSEEDLAIEADRTEALSSDSMITVNDEAGCSLTEPAATDVERDGSHSEITVSWRYSCDDPDAIEQVDAAELFAEFPNFEDIDTQWISESKQSSAELSPSTTAFTLER